MDVTFGEMIMLAVLALLIFGPERLPGIARSVGQTIGRVRREAMSTFEALRDETELGELGEISSELQREREEWRTLTRLDTPSERRTTTRKKPAKRSDPPGPPRFDGQAT